MILELGVWAACSGAIYAGLRWRDRRSRKPEPAAAPGSFCPKCADLAASASRVGLGFHYWNARACRETNHAPDRIALPPDFLGPVNGCACRSCAVTRRAKVPEITPTT